MSQATSRHSCLCADELRITIPKINEALTPKQSSMSTFRKDRRVKRKHACNIGRHPTVQKLRFLESGDDVRVQDIPCINKVPIAQHRDRGHNHWNASRSNLEKQQRLGDLRLEAKR